MSLAAVKLEVAEAVRQYSAPATVPEAERARLKETTFHYPEKRLTPPGFVVTLPDDMDPTVTYGRGSSNMVIIGWLLLPINDMRGADELACEFYEPANPTNLVKLIQDRRYSACAKVMVDNIKFEPVILGEVLYLGGRNTLHVFGMGK